MSYVAPSISTISAAPETEHHDETPPRWPARHFHSLGYTLTILTLGSNIPTALYGLYRAELGFSPLTQTAIFAAYVATLVPALFLLGPLSDRTGRRPVLLAGLAAGALGAIVLATAHTTGWLFAGRLLQGLSIGACSAAGAAALLEHVPAGHPRRAARAATVTAAGGCALGPLWAGLAAEYLPHPLVTPYAVFVLALVPALVTLLTLPAAATARTPGRLLEPPRVPAPIRSVFTRAALPVAASWAVAGLFLSVAPAWITGLLGTTNLLVGAAAASLMLVCSVVTQFSMRGLEPLTAQRIGLACNLLGVVGLALVGAAPNLILLLAVTTCVGIGHGLTFAGGMQRVSAAIATHAPDAGGSVLAAFFTCAYTGMALSSLAVGLLMNHQSATTAVTEFSIATALVTVIALVLNINRHG